VNGSDGYVAALDQAFADVASELVAWAGKNI
jgi:ABC-type uncharacterized transport system auxiliary subunit